MSTAYSAAGWDRRLASARRVVNFLETCWDAFQERRKRERLRADLFDPNDRELMDIGISRGEIDFVASNRGIDPRGVRSNPPINV
ncbi:DUF1127 domain-containing protein [Bradyrhizobium sp. CB82]|uniref:DUF1127 domain-containing protein n=1 Tax=Bradyrhizobium sp. CB82 TaxID=3039159 RepID=UPI0024B24C59|nr:DUF1127 domain-containing protein [Bradyrhizobium sp. CB82]WFU39362.1 DUF1127 domain-containing protein [Bradyrhizobium sp. CB82]